jgi:hypothetical protein
MSETKEHETAEEYKARIEKEVIKGLKNAQRVNEERWNKAAQKFAEHTTYRDTSGFGKPSCPHTDETPTLIIGDIHSNFAKDRSRIEKAIEGKQPHKIVFLGDYVDTRDQSPFDPEDAEILMKDLELFVDWIKKLDLPHVCLCGNHDWGYLSNGEFPTGQTIQPKDGYDIPEGFVEEVSKLLLELKLQLCEIVFNKRSLYMCSHAGFCGKWLKLNNLFNEETRNKNFYANDPAYAEDIYRTVNKMFEYLLENRKIAHPNVIEFCGRKRGGWDVCSGPLWCDRQELMNDYPNCFNQIVGHTKSMGNCDLFLHNRNKRELWSIDTSSNSKIGKCGILSTDEL